MANRIYCYDGTELQNLTGVWKIDRMYSPLPHDVYFHHMDAGRCLRALTLTNSLAHQIAGGLTALGALDILRTQFKAHPVEKED